MKSRTVEYFHGMFGKMTMEIDADGKVLDAAALKAFTQGQCHSFALAVHQLTGWTLAAIAFDTSEFGREDIYSGERDAEPAHILCLTPDGQLFDIHGTGARRNLQRAPAHRVQPTDEARVRSLQTYLKPNLEAALPFARTLLEKEGYTWEAESR